MSALFTTGGTSISFGGSGGEAGFSYWDGDDAQGAVEEPLDGLVV